MPVGVQLREEGRQEGRQDGQREELPTTIEIILELRFGNESKTLLPDIARITGVEQLRTIRDCARTATTLAEVATRIEKLADH